MTLAATATDLIVYAPLSFMLGVVFGLGASSRWRIVRRNNGA